MGRLNHDQRQLFYSFCLEDVVPDDHLVRAIAGVLDLSWVHTELAPYYSHIGRPSIDPVLMVRTLVIGYVFAIRSERALCREVQVNLAYRWFCGLSIEDKVADHSAFSRVRNERLRDSDLFRIVFERVVEACIRAGLVGGESFAVDAKLNHRIGASRARSVPRVCQVRTDSGTVGCEIRRVTVATVSGPRSSSTPSGSTIVGWGDTGSAPTTTGCCRRGAFRCGIPVAAGSSRPLAGGLDLPTHSDSRGEAVIRPAV